ncbi:hypothetical protein NEMIN01_0178 [Nematocida minor]|uniref:uncharacterized protein n=1 Tax=Nematocida minor TaxID=1912983 RepID=UPI00221E7AF6|nr:uncharacterized protein NEMIN01_0074 [Nematocida minor]XP_051332080.1 uncharacterized protein NEMIN01_0178 [Nematocida minor]KAI5188810.1 hypothetical protein NEMIN01_0074 [Nematocida minor]KAI5188914.1 hypothetical protein NEMIN01_0178 [Nematocida minor]
MHSEYEKKIEKLKSEKKKADTSKSSKDTDKKDAEKKEMDQKELESHISEAEAIDLCTLEAKKIAKELTATEVKILMDITPIEILKFSYDSEEEASPTLVGYIKFTKGLSSYVTTSVLDCLEEKTEKVQAHRQFHAQSEKTAAQKHWVDVMKALVEQNNRNSADAVFKGLMKTDPPRILKEEISDLLKKSADAVSQETEKDMQTSNILYIRDVKSVEKHLIDASCNKNDRESPAKFRRIIEYLNYIRAHAEVEIDEKINHALVHTFRNAKDVRTGSAKESEVFYTGCFLFLENSSFISLE